MTKYLPQDIIGLIQSFLGKDCQILQLEGNGNFNLCDISF